MSRPWIKVRTPGGSDSQEVMDILKAWKTIRQMSYHCIRAIRLYNALLRGDSSLLSEFFPGISIAMGRPVPVRRPALGAPAISFEPQSEEADLSDFMESLGTDGLEF